jgi:D-glycero-D-manno-heptose 1,7-bisphosphate phosphatase
MNRAVFLDRDGVINYPKVIDGKPYPPDSLPHLKLLPKVADALNLLHDAGFLLIVVTNQPDVARGKVSIDVVEEMNNYLKASLPLDYIYSCYHDDYENCHCRKPKPGALIEAASIYKIDLSKSFMVGDRWRDVEAGESAGCKTFFIDYGYNEKHPDAQDYTVRSLYEATKIIIGLD